DVRESDLLPELEGLLVSKQHVAAGFQPEVLTDPFAGDRFPDCKAMPLMNERDVVNNENTRLADGGEILDHAFGAAQPIAAAIERPGAAERAVPWATSGKFDRGAGVEHADEIFAAGAPAIPPRPHPAHLPPQNSPRP